MVKRGALARSGPSVAVILVASVQSNPKAMLAELVRRTGGKAHKQTIRKVLRDAEVERYLDGYSVDGWRVRIDVAAATKRRYGIHRHPPRSGNGADLPELFDRCKIGVSGRSARHRGAAGYSAEVPSSGAARCLLLWGRHKIFLALPCRRTSRHDRMFTGPFGARWPWGDLNGCITDRARNDANATDAWRRRGRQCSMLKGRGINRKVQAAGMTRANRSKDASVIWFSTPQDSCWPSMSALPASRIAMARIW